MAKKFFDIIPPQKIKTPQDFRRKKKAKKANRFLLKGFILFFLILILVGLSGFLLFSKAKIEIWPEAETLNLEEKITIDSNYDQFKSAIWVEEGIIPGKIFEDEKFSSQEFFASGKALRKEKAGGTIRVYNDYHLAQGLVANTRFQPPLESFQSPLDGEIGEAPWFRTLEKTVIPSKGYKDIRVIADSPGEKYNIKPTKFSIPGLMGLPQYTLVYGESFEKLEGGFSQEASQVTEEDLERAKNALAEKLKKESRDFLKATLPLDFVLLDQAIPQEIIESNASLEAGAGAESFNYRVRISSKGIGFKRTYIEEFAKSLIGLNTPENKKLQEESLEIDYSPELVDVKSGKTVLNLKIKAKIYSDINLIELKKALLGRTLKEVKIFLENYSQITKIEVKSWPIWRKKIPENLDKVELKLRVD